MLHQHDGAVRAGRRLRGWSGTRRVLPPLGLVAVAVLMIARRRRRQRAARPLRVAPDSPFARLAGWLAAAAITVETLSYLAYARGQRVLATAGQRLPVRWLASLAMAGQALSNFLSAGYVAGNVLNFRELRRRRLTASGIWWLLLMTTVLYVGVLAGLGLVGGGIAGGHGGQLSADLQLGALAVLAALLVAAATAAVLARGGRLRRLRAGAAAAMRRRDGPLPDARDPDGRTVLTSPEALNSCNGPVGGAVSLAAAADPASRPHSRRQRARRGDRRTSGGGERRARRARRSRR